LTVCKLFAGFLKELKASGTFLYWQIFVYKDDMGEDTEYILQFRF